MSLELFANELLLEIFGYLPSVHVLQAFYRLNTRFDQLIHVHFQTSRFDFRAATIRDFYNVCPTYFPYIKDHLVSLGLSDDDETPNQIELFRSDGWTLDRFPHLRSLSFDHLRSSEIIGDILVECPQLVRLSLTGCYFACTQKEILHFMNIVWRLPKLIYCYLNMDFKHGSQILSPTIFSAAIEHLTIIGVSYPAGQVINLCEHTPRLRYLALDLSCPTGNIEFHTTIPLITEVNFIVIGAQHEFIENLLRCMPNLCQLKIETCYVDMNGYEWEQLIRKYLPKLKHLQLKMRSHVMNEKYRKELFTSFQTPFWIKEHQWFIRYHYNQDHNANMVCFYTLPYNFSTLDIHFPVLYKSTCLNEKDYLSYDNVRNLSYHSSAVNEMTGGSDFEFPNINSLSVKLPINNHLLSLMRKLNQLHSLKITRPSNISDEEARKQLQTLLDHTPHLYYLKFHSWSQTTQQQWIRIANQSIRKLNLLGYNHWFTQQDCVELSQSSLGINCEVLYIKVEKRNDICYLIETMRRLRALIVRSKDDDGSNLWATDNLQLERWLQQYLPPRCSIKRDSRYVHHVRIWIDL
ncbi:unnamed protein product [Adineta ricciae]|uniref:F-box domain-containing protein n=2 Tax=Adineta ricciae TaxID=249248 RepID=A0A815H1A4_ADIRI|nr:unnamed protein product [Adineta ricciae]